MAIWRVRFRLTSVAIEGRRIVATINPSMTLAEGWTMEENLVIAAVDRVCGGLIAAGRQEMAGVASATRQQQMGAQSREIQVVDTRGRSVGAGAASVTRSRQEFIVGTTDSGQAMAAGRTPEQTYRPSFPTMFGVAGGGAGGGRGRRYDQLAASLGSAPVGDWMQLMMRNQPLPAAAVPYRHSLEEMYTLSSFDSRRMVVDVTK